MAPQFIFTMKDLRKVTPQGKEILQGDLAVVLPGAKIGVLGANGAGKSTLLRIMAGVDKDFAGEAFPAEGTRIGFLPQEPQLDPTKTVLEHVEEAVAAKRAILKRYEELSGRTGPDGERGRAGPRCRTRSTPQNLWELDRHVEIAMDALRLPPGDADVTHALRRRAPPRGALPAAAPAQRHAAPRRADEPPRRRVGGLARAVPEGVQGHASSP